MSNWFPSLVPTAVATLGAILAFAPTLRDVDPPVETYTIFVAKGLLRPGTTIRDPATAFEKKVIAGVQFPEGAIRDVENLKGWIVQRLHAGDIVTTHHVFDGVGCEYGPGPYRPLPKFREYGLRLRQLDKDITEGSRVDVLVTSNDDGCCRKLVENVLVIEIEIVEGPLPSTYAYVAVRLDDVLPIALAEGEIHLRPSPKR